MGKAPDISPGTSVVLVVVALGLLAGSSAPASAQGWKRHTPWAHIERAARRIDKESREATREIHGEERSRAQGKRVEPDARARPADERTAPSADAESAPEAGGEAAEEPGSLAGRALAAAVIAGVAGAGAAAAIGLRRRRRSAAEQGGQATLVAPIAPPEPARAMAPRTFDDGPRYEIVERIGAGGMGVVYRARDRRLSREVALKRLSEQLIDHPKAVRYFLREARAVAGLSHPNIVTLFDVDEEDGVPFLTMELLDGRNLSQIVAARGPFPSRITARLGAQAAAGLACAHARGIVHRDVKSANLFLTRAGVLKVMDFGLATMAEELRRTGTVLGTPQYMAPEQARGEAADHRVDLYALGVTLFHLSTASWPFEDGDIAHHHRHTPAPDPRGRRPELAPPLAELILACMAKDPDKRPANAEDVAARLQALAQAEAAGSA